jgi:hypothetical protein
MGNSSDKDLVRIIEPQNSGYQIPFHPEKRGSNLQAYPGFRFCQYVLLR